mmetsp:Transcript_50248/g.166395  ORF Transcript_50248/g.166395 Transcript_50248/m.166395 type:complete len:85 (+) Transcript_50248:208-462(+)
MRGTCYEGHGAGTPSRRLVGGALARGGGAGAAREPSPPLGVQGCALPTQLARGLDDAEGVSSFGCSWSTRGGRLARRLGIIQTV